MLVNHVHHALEQVRELKARVIEAQLFRGYSGVARGCGAICALAGGVVMDLSFYPRTLDFHALGWGAVCMLALLLNYGAVAFWYLSHPREERALISLQPVYSALPALVVAGILTLAMLRSGAEDLLFGTWMCLFGLINTGARRFLPSAAAWLGWYYVTAGVLCLFLLDDAAFLNPWPMALVFFLGESVGAVIFYRHRVAESHLLSTRENHHA